MEYIILLAIIFFCGYTAGKVHALNEISAMYEPMLEERHKEVMNLLGVINHLKKIINEEVDSADWWKK
jgi:hypothetical protein